jgi:hypothetical protein
MNPKAANASRGAEKSGMERRNRATQQKMIGVIK